MKGDPVEMRTDASKKETQKNWPGSIGADSIAVSFMPPTYSPFYQVGTLGSRIGIFMASYITSIGVRHAGQFPHFTLHSFPRF